LEISNPTALNNFNIWKIDRLKYFWQNTAIMMNV